MKVYVVTFLYTKALPYLPELFESLSSQKYRDFELIIFNDGVDNPEQYFRNVDFSIKVVEIDAESILEVRVKAFEYLRLLPECKIIFQDADDCLSNNRISISIELLNKYSIICNDLCAFNKIEKPGEGLWKDRLGENFEFDHQFLLNQNILGFGNTAIVSSMLNHGFKSSNLDVVPDWFLFYQLMFNSKKLALFTPNCQTFYRIHDSNLIGIKDYVLDKTELMKIINAKQHQYLALQKIGIATDNAMRILEEQKRRLKYYRNRKQRAPFWWEQTELLNE